MSTTKLTSQSPEASTSPGISPQRSPQDATISAFQQEAADIVAYQAETGIEVSEGSDTDPGYMTDSSSTASTSISSSVRDYTFENGRRYHKFREGAYAIPNDDAEQDREDMKHAMVVNLCGGRLHYAPLEN